MADIINQITRNKTLGQIPQEWKDYADNLSPQDRQVLKQQIQQEIVARQSQENKSKLGNVLFNAGNRLREVGGKARIEDPEGKQRASINDFIMKEMIKKQMEGDPYDKLKRELQIKAEIQQQDPVYQAQLKAINTPDPKLPGEDTINQQNINPINPTNPPQGKSGIKYKPIYKNIAGIPKIVGYEEVPLSATEYKRIEDEKVAETANSFIIDSANDNLDTIAEVKKGIKFFGALGPIPTTNPWYYERKKWETNVQKLLQGKIVELIQKMKSASKTGATGFGQLSDTEGKILKEASTALNRGLDPTYAQELLDKMEIILKKVIRTKSPQSQGVIPTQTMPGAKMPQNDDPLGIR